MIRFFKWIGRKSSDFFKWYKNLYKGRAWYTKLIAGLVSLLVAFILYLGMVDINFLWLFGKSPGYFSGIMDPHASEASEIYSADGVLIGKFFNENRTPVTYDEVNPAFWKALIDTEDERFYKHLGVDPIGLFAAAKDAFLNHDARGASTITQQLAKNLFRMRTNYSTGLFGKDTRREDAHHENQGMDHCHETGIALFQGGDSHDVCQYGRLRFERFRHQDGLQDLLQHDALAHQDRTGGGAGGYVEGHHLL